MAVANWMTLSRLFANWPTVNRMCGALPTHLLMVVLNDIAERPPLALTPAAPTWQVIPIYDKQVVAVMGVYLNVASHGTDRSTYKFLVVFGHELDQVLHDEYRLKSRREAVYGARSVG